MSSALKIFVTEPAIQREWNSEAYHRLSRPQFEWGRRVLDRLNLRGDETIADAGCGIDVVADLLGHASVSSSQVYVHPDPGRLRAAVDAVPSPREQAGVTS